LPDVVIVGAGIVGASIAYHLKLAGVRDVVLLEREAHTGKGSTGKSMGGVRAQFATDPNIRMSLHAIRFFQQHAAQTGYRPQGYLFAATTQAHLAYLRANLALQRHLGLTQAREVSQTEIQAAVPEMRVDDILGGSFCPTDGFVDPHSALQFFLEGARVLKSTAALEIHTQSGKITGIETSTGLLATPIVVNAAGAWAAEVAAMAGIHLPVAPLRRALVPTEPFSRLSHALPMVVDMSTGFHFRPESLGFLLAWNDSTETTGFRTGVAPGFIEKLLEHAANRVPAFAEAEVNPRRAWAGLYEVSPDHHAILGPVPSLAGFYCANGFSGHGVMHSPATGQILADLITTGTTTVLDAKALSLDRFRTGQLLHETAVL
jgi:sarcosine oxidase subunit beta